LRYHRLLLRQLNFLILLAILLAACGQPAATVVPTATAPATRIFPPTWTPSAASKGTLGPSAVPRPTRTLAPIATPAASTVFTSTDEVFTLQLPSNWSTQSGEREVISRQSQKMKYVASGAPGTAPQPAVLIFYQWPAAGPIDNDTAWQQAYVVASLAIKVCPITLTAGDAITLGGETGKYIGYVDSCGVQGELIGFVHAGVNYGALIEAPQAVWETWRPRLRGIVGSLKFVK
jgi:hypothetical protein